MLAIVNQAPDGLNPASRRDVEKGIRAASSAADVFWSVEDRVARFFDPKVPKHESIRYFWNRPTDAQEDSWLEEHPGVWTEGAKPRTKIPTGAEGNRRNAPIDPRERAAASVPLPRVGEAQDIANGVLFLCTDAGNYITGQELVIDGGYTAH